MSLAELLNIPSVRSFLFDGTVMAEYRAVAEKHKLPKERSKEFLDLCNAIIDGNLPLAEVPGILAQAFGISEAESKAIAADIVGYRVFPLQDFISGVAEQIVAWGGDPKSYPIQKIGKEKVSAFMWASRVAEATKLGFSDVLVKRLALLLEGRSSGEKTAETLRTFFGRPLTIGGLALSKDKVDALSAEIERELPYTVVVSEEEFKKLEAEKVKEEELEEEAEVEPPTPSIPLEGGRSELVIAPVKELAAEVPAKVGFVPDQSAEMADGVVEAVREILLAEKIPLEKFRALAEKNIRGVREPGQTRDILEKDFKLSGADLRVVLDALREGKKRYDGERVREGEKGLEKVEEGKESNALDQKFAELTKTLPEESIEPIMPGARVSAARETQGSSDKKIVPLKPRLAKAELTVGSVAPKAVDRKVTDIVAGSRLMGPVDQLKNMSTTEFRRMSSDPAEAARKVEDLILGLAATSYEEKISGIGAWRKSLINQMYLSISEEALGAGMTIPDVCSKRRKEGKDCLSPSEIKAIIGLNAKLRF